MCCWVILGSAHRNLMRNAPLVTRITVEGVDHGVRVHTCSNSEQGAVHHDSALHLFKLASLPGAPHPAEEPLEEGEDWAEGGSELTSLPVWPRGPLCCPRRPESEWPGTASGPATPLGQEGQQDFGLAGAGVRKAVLSDRKDTSVKGGKGNDVSLK